MWGNYQGFMVGNGVIWWDAVIPASVKESPAGLRQVSLQDHFHQQRKRDDAGMRERELTVRRPCRERYPNRTCLPILPPPWASPPPHS